MTWREFIQDNADTLGITLFFSALASAFMLKAREGQNPITPARALLVISSGQIVGSAATAFLFGYLGWNIFIAPAIGAITGLTGVFVMMGTIKSGERVEERGGELGDAGMNIVKKHFGGGKKE